eukprot:TRINITY_DN6156_c0_g2_i4.p1 TRINITY_DN6156_c0_g2~~TRINITY_DN6156_c0_g2_i4.p1  ORF type:complete len:181 (+),score=35.85 TRINITY_DN6156_c0_g2_i4:312-854(+)
MGTSHQFLLMSSPPEKEAVFTKLKEKHGSYFAFHGSPVENWHSIMRHGLKNASGTKLQLHGTAHGHGVYLSTLSSTSFSYSRMYNSGGGGTKPTKKQDYDYLDTSSTMSCIALCEVADVPGIRKDGSIHVAPGTDCVTTRFFFVYDSKSYMGNCQSADTMGSTFKKEIEHALHPVRRNES